MLLIAFSYLISLFGISVFFYKKLKNTDNEINEINEDDAIYINVLNYCIENLDYNGDDTILVDCSGDMASIALLRILSNMYNDVHVINTSNISNKIKKLFTNLNDNNMIQYHEYPTCDENYKTLYYDNICSEYNIKYIFKPLTVEDKTNTIDILNSEIYKDTMSWGNNTTEGCIVSPLYTIHEPFNNMSIDCIKDFIYEYNIVHDDTPILYNHHTNISDNIMYYLKNGSQIMYYPNNTFYDEVLYG